jgi:hypothetical protein
LKSGTDSLYGSSARGIACVRITQRAGGFLRVPSPGRAKRSGGYDASLHGYCLLVLVSTNGHNAGNLGLWRLTGTSCTRGKATGPVRTGGMDADRAGINHVLLRFPKPGPGPGSPRTGSGNSEHGGCGRGSDQPVRGRTAPASPRRGSDQTPREPCRGYAGSLQVLVRRPRDYSAQTKFAGLLMVQQAIAPPATVRAGCSVRFQPRDWRDGMPSPPTDGRQCRHMMRDSGAALLR